LLKEDYDALLEACRGIDPNTVTIEAVPLLQNAENDPGSYKSIDVHVLCPVVVAESENDVAVPHTHTSPAIVADSESYDTYDTLNTVRADDVALIDFAEVAESVLN